jgi:hypothetical protein
VSLQASFEFLIAPGNNHQDGRKSGLIYRMRVLFQRAHALAAPNQNDDRAVRRPT